MPERVYVEVTPLEQPITRYRQGEWDLKEIPPKEGGGGFREHRTEPLAKDILAFSFTFGGVLVLLEAFTS